MRLAAFSRFTSVWFLTSFKVFDSQEEWSVDHPLLLLWQATSGGHVSKGGGRRVIRTVSCDTVLRSRSFFFCQENVFSKQIMLSGKTPHGPPGSVTNCAHLGIPWSQKHYMYIHMYGMEVLDLVQA